MNFFLTCVNNGLFSELKDESVKKMFLEGKSTYIKSKLMSETALFCENNGLLCERYLSKYDYDKLSAVYIPAKKLLIADSVLFSAYPETGVKIINTDKLFNLTAADFPESIISNEKKASILKSDAAKFENAVKTLYYENKKTVMPYINRAKILNYILRFIKRSSLSQSEKAGKSRKKSLCAVTPWGIHTCYETVMLTCKNVIVIKDEFRCIADMLIHGLSEAFNQCGKDTVVCTCSIDQNVFEHLIVPELSLAFFTSNREHPYPFGDTGVISASRFYKEELKSSDKSSLLWNNELCDGFIDEAVYSLFEALEADNSICDFMNRYLIEEKYSKTLSELKENLR